MCHFGLRTELHGLLKGFLELLFKVGEVLSQLLLITLEGFLGLGLTSGFLEIGAELVQKCFFQFD